LGARAELVAVSNYPVVRVHALVSDEETARRAAAGGATVVQLRLKEAPTRDVVALGRRLVDLGAELIVNDDLDAALELGCGVHLGQNDPGVERARAAGLQLGISVATRREAAVAEFAGATYLGAGPIWATPSKADAGEPIGLDGLRDICLSVTIPVVAIGGIDASNAAECIRAGAAGVAVIRAVAEIEALRAAVDAAF
jgi:thiamine-phosphate pyrophosphorylase